MLSRKGLSTLVAGLVGASIVVSGAVAHVSTTPARPDNNAKTVYVRDSCTSSFNVFFGDPGICQQSDGKVEILDFLAYLSKHGSHPLWRFSSESLDLPAGKHIELANLGGEFHTWTKVANFGGGIIPALNFGQPTVPECGSAETGLAPETLNNVYLNYQDVEKGATAGTPLLPPGTHKFMCCIHPWMQTVVHVNNGGATVASAITPTPAHSHAEHRQR